MNPTSKSFLYHLCTCIYLVATMAAGAADLFSFDKSFDPSKLTARSMTVSVANGALEISGTSRTPYGGVVFPLPEASWNLSRFRFVEADLENTGDKPLILSVWAVSGQGWGGVSTFTSAGGPASGRETLAPGQRATFKIDLYARYNGKEVYTPATNPASIHSLELILGGSPVPLACRVHSLRATGDGTTQALDASKRLLVPDISGTTPGPGRRVYQKLRGWENTSVTHVLTLPRNWQRGHKYPIIVEYTGNVFYHKFCHSTGYTDQANMAYGLSRGEDFICLNLPFVSKDGHSEENNGWGDIDKTADYCIAAVDSVCDQYGGDKGAVFFVGFSRGKLAANYLALRNDKIATLWRGFIGTNPGQAWDPASGTGWNNVATGWDERAARMQGRPWFSAPANMGSDVHVDVEFLEDRPSTVATRNWMKQVLSGSSTPPTLNQSRK